MHTYTYDEIVRQSSLPAEEQDILTALMKKESAVFRSMKDSILSILLL